MARKRRVGAGHEWGYPCGWGSETDEDPGRHTGPEGRGLQSEGGVRGAEVFQGAEAGDPRL